MASLKTLLTRIESLERMTPKETRQTLFVVAKVGESEEEASARTLAGKGKRREDFAAMSIVIELVRSANSQLASVVPIHAGMQ